MFYSLLLLLLQDSVLVYKLHEFDPEALRLCAGATVLTQHRNLLDAYGSAVAAYGMADDVSAAHAVGTIQLWARAATSSKHVAFAALVAPKLGLQRLSFGSSA